jgi:hypothetical protein
MKKSSGRPHGWPQQVHAGVYVAAGDWRFRALRGADWNGRETLPLNSLAGPFTVLDEHVETASGTVSISTMHLAKGLEFRAVVVMACDDEVIPLQERIETVGPTMPTCRRSTTPSAICSMSPALARGIICW